MRTRRDTEGAADHAAPRPVARVAPQTPLGQLTWLQRAAGNQATSRALAGPGGGDQLAVQRLTLVPFDKADGKLTKFAGEQGPYQAARKPTAQVGKDEPILVVGHGNGTAISNYITPTAGGGDYVELPPKDLAELLKAIMPKGYSGVITVWACQAARPWRHIDTISKQLPSTDKALDYTFLSILHLWLPELRQNQLRGPIGFVTLDLPRDRARVYADEQWKMLSGTLIGDEGFARVGEPVNTDFYRPPAIDEDSDSDDEDFVGKDEAMSSEDSELEVPTTKSSDPPDLMQVDEDEEHIPGRTRKERALDSIVATSPWGTSSRPLSLRERLELLKKKK